MRRVVSGSSRVSLFTRRLISADGGVTTTKPTVSHPHQAQNGNSGPQSPFAQSGIGASPVLYGVTIGGDPRRNASSASQAIDDPPLLEEENPLPMICSAIDGVQSTSPKPEEECAENISPESSMNSVKSSASDVATETGQRLPSGSADVNTSDLSTPHVADFDATEDDDSDFCDTFIDSVSPENPAPPREEPPRRLHMSGINSVSISNSAELTSELKRLGESQAFRIAGLLYKKALSTKDIELVNPAVIQTAIPILRRLSWARTISETLHYVKENNLKVPTSVYNGAFAGIMRDGRTKDIEHVIERMWTQQPHSHPNASSYNHLIGAYFYRGELENAFSVLSVMKQRGIYPALSTYRALIAGCVRMNNPRRAFETFLILEQQRFEVNPLTVAQVMVACADADDLSAVSQLMASFDSAISWYSSEVEEHRYHRQGVKIDPLLAMDGSGRGEPKLEISGLMSLLQMAYRIGAPEVAEKAMAWCSKWYHIADIPNSAWYCLIGAYACTADFPSAFYALTRMRAAGIKPSAAELHDALIKPLSSDLAKVDEQYYRLVTLINTANYLTLDVQGTFSSDVGGSLAEASALEKDKAQIYESAEASCYLAEAKVAAPPEHGGLSLENDLNQQRLYALSSEATLHPPVTMCTVGIDEMNCIIAACSAAGDLERASQTFEEVPKLGLVANVDTFNALLAGCVTVRNVRGGLRLLVEMDEAKVDRNSETSYLVTRLYLRSGQFKEAVQAIEDAADEGVPITSGTFQTLTRKLCQVGDRQLLERMESVADRNGVTKEVLYSRVDGRSRWMSQSEVDGGICHDEVGKTSDGDEGEGMLSSDATHRVL